MYIDYLKANTCIWLWYDGAFGICEIVMYSRAVKNVVDHNLKKGHPLFFEMITVSTEELYGVV